jgi:23S rRNA (uridine2552-2'-O)-methyltransferase
MSHRTASSSRWRRRQDKDPYVERAVREGWRSRAVFKLDEINLREKLLRRGMVSVDLGSAPGAWSQYAARKIGPGGRVLAVDLLPMDGIPGVEFFLGDFTSPALLAGVRNALGERPIDLVMSDMAPNLSGHSAIDLPRHIGLAEEVLLFAEESLRSGGDLLIKLFQGEGFDEFVRNVRPKFRKTRLIKPAASRPESREIYLLARQHGM